MRKLIIGFATAKRWNPFSALIRWWWGTEYSHVYVRYATPFTYRDGEIVDDMVEASGTAVRMVSDRLWTKKNRIIEEYEFEVEKEELFAIVSKLRTLLGRPYGWKQVLGIAIAELFRLKTNPFADGNRTLVCSELGLIVLDVLGFRTRHLPQDLVSPKAIKDILDGEN